MSNLSVLQKHKLIKEQYDNRTYSTNYTSNNLYIYHESILIGAIWLHEESKETYIYTPYYRIKFGEVHTLTYNTYEDNGSIVNSLTFVIPMQKDEYFNLVIQYPQIPTYEDIEYYINNRIDKTVLIY